MGAKRNCFPQKEKIFLEGGEVVAAASDEAQLLDMEADDFASWADALGGEELAQALEQERAAELRTSWSRTSGPLTITPSWRTRRRKPRLPAKSG